MGAQRAARHASCTYIRPGRRGSPPETKAVVMQRASGPSPVGALPKYPVRSTGPAHRITRSFVPGARRALFGARASARLSPLRRRPRLVASPPSFFQLLCDPGGCRVGQAARMAAAFRGRRSRGMPFFRPSASITSRPVSAGFIIILRRRRSPFGALAGSLAQGHRHRRNGASHRNGKAATKCG